MTETNVKTEAFFDKPAAWQEELRELRSIVLNTPLSEDFKWRSPCYTFQGGNVATLWRMKDYAALAFFKGVLLKDGEGVFVAPGENSRSMRFVSFTGNSEVRRMEPTIKAYILEAIEIEKSGQKVEFPKDDLEYPEELIAKLDEDPELSEAFAALTPGRRRGYILHFSQAKQSATRSSRIEKATPRILAGKGMHDR